MTLSLPPRSGVKLLPLSAGMALVLVGLAIALPAEAHHLMALTRLAPTPLTGFLSGLAHPILGPDHLLFLCALALVGPQRWAPWLLAFLATGLLGSVIGLVAASPVTKVRVAGIVPVLSYPVLPVADLAKAAGISPPQAAVTTTVKSGAELGEMARASVVAITCASDR